MNMWIFRSNIRALEEYHYCKNLDEFEKVCWDFYLLMGLWYLKNHYIEKCTVWRLQPLWKMDDYKFHIENTYGFYVSGDGIVDLKLLDRQGLSNSNVASDTWTWDGYNVSPVYIYKRNYYQDIEETTVDIGVSTNEAKLYFKDSNVPDNNNSLSISNITTQYINDNQRDT